MVIRLCLLNRLEEILAALFSTFRDTPMWDSLPSIVSTIQEAIVNSTHNIQAQTGEKNMPTVEYSCKRVAGYVSRFFQTSTVCIYNASAFFSTELFHVLQQPLSSLLTDIFHAMNTSSFTAQSFVSGLPQAIVLTAEAALQVRTTTFISTDVTHC